MSYRVLHIIDCYLPETMNWMERLWQRTANYCEHFIFAKYYIKDPNTVFYFINPQKSINYPIGILDKFKERLRFPSTVRKLKQSIIEQKIQILHFHFGHLAIEYRDLLQKLDIPFCVSLYGFDYEYLIHNKPETKQEYIKLANLGGRFIVEGNYSANLIASYGIPASKIFKVHMLFKIENGFSKPQFKTPIKLFQAATFTEKKNQIALVDALKDRHIGKFQISFYGEQGDRNYYVNLLKAIDLKQKHDIRIQGLLPFNAYLKELRNSHFTINLSKKSSAQDTEGGCPVLLKDSLSLARPVITTAHCDIPDIIVNAYNGILLPEDDPEAVECMLDSLLKFNQKEYLQLCRNALETVDINCSNNISAAELRSVYQSMVCES
ncbi:MAG: glycosyltransferase family 4 protein [Saprospiraceae bacterium]